MRMPGKRTPEAGTFLGLEVHVGETDNGRQREAIFSWRDHQNQASSSPRSFGDICLQFNPLAQASTGE